MTDEEYRAWLANPDNAESRCLLVIISKPFHLLYLSTKKYIDGGMEFDDFITKAPFFELSLDDLSYGSVTAEDRAGEFSDYGSFGGSTWAALYGDENMPLSDFFSIGNGIVTETKIDGNLYTFSLSGNDSKLNNKMVGDGGILTVGIAENVGAILQNSSTLTYKVSDGNIDSLTVYDKGVELSEVINNNDGTFKLTNAPAGIITANTRSPGTYTVKSAIDHIASLGGVNQPIYKNLSTAQLGRSVGKAFYAGTTFFDAMQLIANSVGAYVVMGNAMQPYIIKLSGSDSVATITDDDIISGTCKHISTVPALDSVTIKYRPNNCVMQYSDLAGAALSNAEFFTREGKKKTLFNAANNLLNESEELETAIYDDSQADLEAANYKNRRSSDRKIYRVRIREGAADLNIGDFVSIDSSVIPFSSGNIRRVKLFADGNLTEIDILEAAQ